MSDLSCQTKMGPKQDVHIWMERHISESLLSKDYTRLCDQIVCAPAHIVHVGKFHSDPAARPRFKKASRPKNSRQKGSLEINK